MKELTQSIDNLLAIVNKHCPFSDELQIAIDRLRDAVVRLKEETHTAKSSATEFPSNSPRRSAWHF